MARFTSLCVNGLPVSYVGEYVWQRPHSVHEYVSRISFHERSVSFATPKLVAFSRSSFESCPCGESRWKYTVGRPVMMWKCFPIGRKFRNAMTIVMWSSTPNVIAFVAARGDIPYR